MIFDEPKQTVEKTDWFVNIYKNDKHTGLVGWGKTKKDAIEEAKRKAATYWRTSKTRD